MVHRTGLEMKTIQNKEQIKPQVPRFSTMLKSNLVVSPCNSFGRKKKLIQELWKCEWHLVVPPIKIWNSFVLNSLRSWAGTGWAAPTELGSGSETSDKELMGSPDFPNLPSLPQS